MTRESEPIQSIKPRSEPSDPMQFQPLPTPLPLPKPMSAWPFPSMTRLRLALALSVAVVSDVVSILATFIPPIQWIVDIVTAVLLFVILGWQWPLLPGLLAEAIPGLAIFPFWTLVVGSIAALGTIRRDHSHKRGS